MIWAQRRKMTYMLGLMLFLVLVGLSITHKATNTVATCFDQKKNGDEVGIDCGGGCLQYCPNELSEPKVRWVRSFEIAPGIVHSIAYIEHSYPTASSASFKYQFRLYDEKNSLITERTGTTYLGPMGKTAIVDTLIPVGNSSVATTRFSFKGSIPWQKVALSFSQSVIKTDRNMLENFENGTRLTSTLENQSRYSFKDMEVVAILYDYNDNAINISKVLLPQLKALSNETVYFTWQNKIDPKNVSRIEIIPRINPFSSTAI